MKAQKVNPRRDKRECHWAPGVACPCGNMKCKFNYKLSAFKVYTTKPPSEKVKPEKKKG